MKVVAEFENKVIDLPDVGIVMPDGCRLSARVWRPEGDTPVPAILEYIPYRKSDGTLPRDERMHAYFAGHGYAAVRVDMRGNGDSEGLMEDEYTAQELRDACDVIAWLALQPWCSGSVGMMGKSWGGFNCLQTAFLQPPALKAVVSVCATTDRFADDIHFKGGCLLGENFGWGAVMLSFSSRPADPVLRKGWREDWLARLEAQPWLAPRWAGHQARDAYWRHGSVCEDFGRVAVPVLSLGGWADGYMNTVDHLVRGVGAKGIVGPWVHQYPHTAVPGPAIGFLQLALRWWDRWLKGAPNGAEGDPAYRAFMLHSARPDACAQSRPGHWLAEAEWPSPRVKTVAFGLGVGPGVSHPRTPVGYLSQEECGGFEVSVCTPQTLGMAAGEYFPMGLNAEMPGDQAGDDALCACFEMAVGEGGLDLLGAARVRLTLASDQPLAFVVARLCDVGPDGASVRIAHGMLNLCHRDGSAAPRVMEPGEVCAVEVVLDQMAYRLAPGHRLRLALSTTYWPFVWPSPVAATLTVMAGVLSLPVHQGSGVEWVPPLPEAAPEWRHRVVRAGAARRYEERDLMSGRAALVVEDDLGDLENLSHGLVTGETMSERWEVHPGDPLSATATHRWEQRLSRGDWRVRTVASAQMTATKTHLCMSASLTAWEGDTQVFHRDFYNEVPRDFV